MLWRQPRLRDGVSLGRARASCAVGRVPGRGRQVDTCWVTGDSAAPEHLWGSHGERIEEELNPIRNRAVRRSAEVRHPSRSRAPSTGIRIARRSGVGGGTARSDLQRGPQRGMGATGFSARIRSRTCHRFRSTRPTEPRRRRVREHRNRSGPTPTWLCSAARRDRARRQCDGVRVDAPAIRTPSCTGYRMCALRNESTISSTFSCQKAGPPWSEPRSW